MNTMTTFGNSDRGLGNHFLTNHTCQADVHNDDNYYQVIMRLIP